MRQKSAAWGYTDIFTRLSDNGLFTFRIGPKKQIFQVEKDVVSKGSPVLDRMMNNGMKEAQEQTADLDDVSCSTFLTFLKAADSRAKPVAKYPPIGQKLSFGALQVLLLDQNWQQFTCQVCKKKQTLAGHQDFPLCRECQNNGEAVSSGSPRCITPYHCTGAPIYACFTLCTGCARRAGLLDPDGKTKKVNEDFLLLRHVDFERLIVQVFRAPTLSFDACDRLYIKDLQLFKAELADIIDFAKFSDLYGLPHWSTFASWCLLERLANSEHVPDDMARHINNIYLNTPATNIAGKDFKVSFENAHVLRKIAAVYTAHNSGKIGGQACMFRTLLENIEFAIDVLGATASMLQDVNERGKLVASAMKNNKIPADQTTVD